MKIDKTEIENKKESINSDEIEDQWLNVNKDMNKNLKTFCSFIESLISTFKNEADFFDTNKVIFINKLMNDFFKSLAEIKKKRESAFCQ
jgi:hypothetical protein